MNNIINAEYYSHLDFRKNDVVIKVYLRTLEMGDAYRPKLYFLSNNSRDRVVKPKEANVLPSISKAASIYDNTVFGFMKESSDQYRLGITLRAYDGLNKYGRKANPNILDMELEAGLFLDNNFIESYLRNQLLLYSIVLPYWGKIHELSDNIRILNRKKWHEVYGKPAFCMVYWANYYGPETVEKNGGKDKFMNAPCWRVEELSDGGIMLILYPSPLNPASPEKRAIQNKVLKYFGLEPIDDSKLTDD